MSKKKRSNKTIYTEGDLFVVPVHDVFGICVLARKGRGGIDLGYFFGPYTDYPSPKIVSTLEPQRARFVCRFGNLCIENGNWPYFTAADSWDREQWPVPVFASVEPITGGARTVIYSDDLSTSRFKKATIDTIVNLPEDGMWGSLAVVIRLAILFQLAGDRSHENSKKERQARFFFYFSNKAKAAKAGSFLREAGLVAECSPAEEVRKWLVLVECDLDELRDQALSMVELEQFFEVVAERFDGEYDGWEVKAVASD